PYNTHFNYCCNAYVNVDVPDSEPNSCTEFDGNTTLYTKSGQLISTFSADYTLDPAGINITVTDFTSTVNGASYELIPNDAIGWGCGGKFNCTYYLNVNPKYYHDYQFDMMFSVFDSSTTYGVTIAGKIQRRNGILVRHRNEAYTPNDPCWIRNFPLDNGGKALSSFCCTKFQSSKIQRNKSKSKIFRKFRKQQNGQKRYLRGDTVVVTKKD
uniref:CUB domain-containing protein n=1 Tax=Panagrolaimus sp. PS1159 TaxID=55785 RepID=A0AC35FSY2_9BILA